MLSKLHKNKAVKIFNECFIYLEGNVLDVGSGRGYIAKEINKTNKVQCLDVKNDNQTDIPLRIYDGKKIPYKDNSFETVLLCYVLHHAKYPVRLLRECIRVAKKRIIIFEDNPENLLTKPLDIISNRFHGISTPLNFKTVAEWTDIFIRFKLKLIRIKRNVERQWYYSVEHILFVLEV